MLSTTRTGSELRNFGDGSVGLHCDFKFGPLKMSYFRGIDTAIAARGHEVIISKVHPTGSIALRAGQLKQHLLERINGQKVIIVAHSMGGLDARCMLTHLGMADRVKALVTITTPHRGTAFADWCHKHFGQRLGGLRLMKSLNIDIDALADLTTENCARSCCRSQLRTSLPRTRTLPTVVS